MTKGFGKIDSWHLREKGLEVSEFIVIKDLAQN